MKWIREVKRKAPAVELVLVVTSVSVCWFRCENLRITDRLTHTVHEEPHVIINSCVWLSQAIINPDTRIQLIVETELDDLDRVKLIDATHWITRSWHIRKVLWQLSREYRDATVNRLPGYLYPEVASVLYSQLAEELSTWLEKLCECGVVVTHVVSSTQLLLDTFSQCSKPVLLHMFDGKDRHRLLLSENGLPLHMRQAVSNALLEPIWDANDEFKANHEHRGEARNELNTGFAETYISESIAQLSESVFSSLDEVMVIVFGDLMQRDVLECSEEYLAKCLLDLPFEVSYRNISMTEEAEKNENLIVRLAHLKKAPWSDFMMRTSFVGKLWPIKKPLLLQTPKNYRLSRAPEKIRKLLNRSLIVVNQRRRACLAMRCTFFVFLLFLITIVLASKSGILSMHQRASFDAKNEKLTAHYHVLKKHANSLHESPSFISESLLRIQLFDNALTNTPSKIISSVATVVKDFPLVSLTAFSWAVTNEHAESKFINLHSVSIRDSYWGDDASQMQTLVEMSGQLVSEDSLRQKQSELNRFLGVLTKSENITNARIFDSPATSAASSDLVFESGSNFKIHFSIKPL